jgi:hypothetical protein
MTGENRAIGLCGNPDRKCPSEHCDALLRNYYMVTTPSPHVPEREAAYAAIDSERDYQDQKWGDSASSGNPGAGERSIDEFILYISGYSDQLVQVGSTTQDARNKLDLVRKVAALCVACMEQHGTPKRRFTQL